MHKNEIDNYHLFLRFDEMPGNVRKAFSRCEILGLGKKEYFIEEIQSDGILLCELDESVKIVLAKMKRKRSVSYDN